MPQAFPRHKTRCTLRSLRAKWDKGPDTSRTAGGDSIKTLGLVPTAATIFQRFVNSSYGTVIHLLVDMLGVGELTDDGSYWRLVYDDCNHVQVLAREGIDDPEAAAFFVRRHYAKCLTCTLANRPVGAERPNVDPDQVHLVLSADALGAIVSALRSSGLLELADHLDEVLRQLGRAR